MGRNRTIERIKFACQYCGSIVEERINKYNTRKKFNCANKECVSKAKSHPGVENGMHGRTHTSEIKQAQAKRASETHKGMSYEERYGLERANELKSIRSTTFKKTWEDPNRTLSFLDRKHTEESKAKISAKSSAKFTEAYKEKHYYSTDKWTRPQDKLDYEIYKELANWIAPMWSLVKDVDLLQEAGVWHPKNNPGGCVRDHIISRKHGFDILVFPEILRHPSNCKIITQTSNSQKGRKSGLTIEELFSNIEKYNGPSWAEHSQVLDLISKYRMGFRWTRKEASDD